ncbi:hypothetical protein PENTCL1PPCAC_15963, partial [Pristionchus entomophagus]
SQMQFIAYNQKEETCRGRHFPCDLTRYLDTWKISDAFHYKQEPIDASKVVFVTYSSSNHFNESRKVIRSLRAVFDNKIIFYDLGLRPNEILELSNVCNLEVKKFKFEKYPSFVAHLLGYNFKPIIMAEVFSQFKDYWIIDSSVRFFNITPHMSQFYSDISSGKIEPIALRNPTSHSIYATTHQSMLDYLPIDTRLAMDRTMLEGAYLISRSEMTREAVKWNALCALTKDCMAAPGTELHCEFHGDRYRTPANCHRYDQSAINIITTSLLERDGWKRRYNWFWDGDNPMSKFSSIQREDKDGNELFIPCK